MKSAARIAFALVLAVALILPPPLAWACGPYFAVAIFTATAGPDDPVSYAAGNLQLLQPTYWHRPLFVAYRNLIGKPFSPSELKALNAEPTPEFPLTDVQSNASKPTPSPQQAWLIARDAVLAAPSQPSNDFSIYGSSDHFQRGDDYVFYTNCLNGAYRNAAAILQKRVAQFGAQSHAVKDWISAQDQVFDNCSNAGFNSKSKLAIIPAAAQDSDPEIIRADRAYQIAAAHFYTGDYGAALSEFGDIAKDSNSPYAAMAPYLAARTLVRKGTLGNAEKEPDPHSLAQAETKLRAILADEKLAEIHPASQRLLAFITIRVHPAKRFRELESLLTESAAANTLSAGFDQDLTDYLWMLDHQGITVSALAPQPPAENSETPRIVPGDVTDWIFTFQAQGNLAYQHALQRWQETKSLPWLVAAISKAGVNDSGAAGLIAASEKFPQDSPASSTLTFHRLRLLGESGKSADVRIQLDRILSQAQSELDRSARNQFLALRMKLAANLDEFLQYAPRGAAIDIPGESTPYFDTFPPRIDGSKVSPYLDDDSALPLSKSMPLRLLVDATKSTSLPRDLRREIVVAAWTRAILLDNRSTALDLTPLLESLVPELKDSLASFKTAQDPSSQRFAAVFAILQNPGFVPYVRAGLPREDLGGGAPKAFNSIDSYGDNWWGSPKSSSDGDYFRMSTPVSAPLRQIYPDGKIPAPAFLTESDHDEAAKELASLATQPAAPSWLGLQTLAFAKSHPVDPRVPEALHLVVRATRHGRPDDSAGNISRQAFTLLHTKYPDSPWAKKTPYWFQ